MHVHRLAAVGGRDPDRRVLARGRRAADQQRQLEPAPLHLLGHVHHLVERRRDQAGEPDGVCALGDGGVEDRVARDHDAEVDHLVVVAAEHDADDVLADVVHVALHRREHDLALRAAVAPGPLLLGGHVRLQVGDGALHRPRALHHLRQEHLSRAEEVADDLHPVHQRALDHVQRPLGRGARLLGVLLDEVDDAVHERVREPLLDGCLAPGEVELALGRLARDRPREGDEPVGRVGPPVVEHVLDPFEQVGRDVLVDDELARVDDAHVEPGADRVVEEGGVHRLADDVVAAEREGEVRDAAARAGARAALLDQRQRLDERLREAVVLLDPGGDGEHVRVEDDVLGRPAVAGEQVVGAAADLDLALDRVGLPELVEGHHDDAGAVAADRARLLEELLLALLEADRVDDPLALDALQPGLEHREARAVDHDRDPGHLGLGREQVQEGRHRLLAVEQVGVHVHVEEVRAAAHLLERDVDGALVVVRLDQPPEAQRSRSRSCARRSSRSPCPARARTAPGR